MKNKNVYNKDEALKMLIELISVPHGASYAQRQVQLKYDISTKEMWDLTGSKEYKAALKKKNDEKNQRHKKFITANRVSIIDEKKL